MNNICLIYLHVKTFLSGLIGILINYLEKVGLGFPPKKSPNVYNGFLFQIPQVCTKKFPSKFPRSIGFFQRYTLFQWVYKGQILQSLYPHQLVVLGVVKFIITDGFPLIGP